jgi:hypothetical protein
VNHKGIPSSPDRAGRVWASLEHHAEPPCQKSAQNDFLRTRKWRHTSLGARKARDQNARARGYISLREAEEAADSRQFSHNCNLEKGTREVSIFYSAKNIQL